MPGLCGKRCGATPAGRVRWRNGPAAGYSTRVAEREGRIVAYGILMFSPGEAQILNISVVPDARRQGFGRTLLLQFLDDARQFGAEQCFLEVRVSNVPAIMLYEGSGFAPIARRNDYYPPVSPGLAREDALVMRRALTPLWPRSA